MEFQPGASPDYLPMDPKRLLDRFFTAVDTHDLTNLLTCLQVDFEQTYPAHPDDNTMGLEAARETWNHRFDSFPNFRAELIRQAFETNFVWTEWHWQGMRANTQGKPLNQVGVMIFEVEQGLFARCWSYMTDVSEETTE